MEYKRNRNNINLCYTLRVIQNYKKSKEYVHYSFTNLSTAVLAVLTALIPDNGDNVAYIDYNEFNNLPEIKEYEEFKPNNTKKNYILNIRNSLSHRTNKNFSSIDKNEKIDLASRSGKLIELTETELELVLLELEKQIVDKIDIFELIQDNLDKFKNSNIPKPKTESQFIKGLGNRRKEQAIIYKIPNNKKPGKFNEKGITKSEINFAFKIIYTKGIFRKVDFNRYLPECAKEGDCNFTTIGGLLQMLDIAYYEEGTYYFNKI